jgi:hypothetical protein
MQPITQDRLHERDCTRETALIFQVRKKRMSGRSIIVAKHCLIAMVCAIILVLAATFPGAYAQIPQTNSVHAPKAAPHQARSRLLRQ